MHAHSYEDTRTHTPRKIKTNRKSKRKSGKEKAGQGRKKEKNRERTERKRGKKEKKEEKERKSGPKEKKKEGGGWVQEVRGVWVLRRVGPHTNDTRSTQIFFSFSSPAQGQTTQTTPLTM